MKKLKSCFIIIILMMSVLIPMGKAAEVYIENNMPGTVCAGCYVAVDGGDILPEGACALERYIDKGESSGSVATINRGSSLAQVIISISYDGNSYYRNITNPLELIYSDEPWGKSDDYIHIVNPGKKDSYKFSDKDEQAQGRECKYIKGTQMVVKFMGHDQHCIVIPIDNTSKPKNNTVTTQNKKTTSKL